jgi:FixJ family two-component response regulator
LGAFPLSRLRVLRFNYRTPHRASTRGRTVGGCLFCSVRFWRERGKGIVSISMGNAALPRRRPGRSLNSTEFPEKEVGNLYCHPSSPPHETASAPGKRLSCFDVGFVRAAQQFLSRPREQVPNCLILDVNLPDLNGLDLQRLVSVERTDMPIIFVTGYGDVPMMVKAMKTGAVEFLTKPFGDEILLGAIEQALERSRAVLAIDAEMRALEGRYAPLSRREQEVMALVVSGLLNKQVAHELGISEITMKAHRGEAMRNGGGLACRPGQRGGSSHHRTLSCGLDCDEPDNIPGAGILNDRLESWKSV